MKYSRRGFPRILDAVSRLRNRRLPNCYPKYVFGWAWISGEELARISDELFGLDAPSHTIITYYCSRWRERADARFKFKHTLYTNVETMANDTLFYITSNETEEDLARASDEEFVKMAMEVLQTEEKGKWFHFDLF
ncbi:hypothetical protein K523DRAFT_412066 [Schizophyllum commune Tattone D]|nr:hypothetical protein K523DRAFT_412066 [Schizophyllum commune Tattone D]